jgi:predicted RNA-binding Zn-ribbon protein involved in translation (DUF1610 family)
MEHDFGTITVNDTGGVQCKNCGEVRHYTDAYGGECKNKTNKYKCKYCGREISHFGWCCNKRREEDTK